VFCQEYNWFETLLSVDFITSHIGRDVKWTHN